MTRRCVIVVLSIATVFIAVVAIVIPPPVEGYWQPDEYKCMCGHTDLLHFGEGSATLFQTAHREIPMELGVYTWDSSQKYATVAERPDFKFFPGWFRYRLEYGSGTVETGHREFRPWLIRDVLSKLSPPTPYQQARRHVPWDPEKVVGRPLMVMMSGEFVLEGPHTFPESFEVEDAIIAAGGFTDNARDQLGVAGFSNCFYEIDLNPDQNGLILKPVEGSPSPPPLRQVREIYIWKDKSGPSPATWKEWSRVESLRRKEPAETPNPKDSF